MYIETNLHESAIFKTRVYRGVTWVPINTLGVSHYSNSTMKCMIEARNNDLTSEEIYKKISNLYEFIQFIQLSDFQVKEDNVFSDSEGLIWESHNNGLEALKQNGGCCASVAALVNTTLKKRYDLIKIIVIITLNGSCHVLNYIEDNKKKYIVDAYAMTNEYKKYIPVESGKLSDYLQSKILTGVLLEVDSLEDFFEFYRRYSIKKDNCYDFFFVENDVVPCISLIRENEDIIIYLKEDTMKLISKDRKKHNLRINYIE